MAAVLASRRLVAGFAARTNTIAPTLAAIPAMVSSRCFSAGSAGPSTSSVASVATRPGFLPNYSPPDRGDSLSIQLHCKAFHPHYLNRFAVLMTERMRNLGIPKPSQVFLPKKRELYTVLRGPHIDKKARDQFERVTHKRLLTFAIPPDSANIELAYRLLSSVANVVPGVEVRARYFVKKSRGGAPAAAAAPASAASGTAAASQ
jgi:small subunit ribosomal protein S10